MDEKRMVIFPLLRGSSPRTNRERQVNKRTVYTLLYAAYIIPEALDESDIPWSVPVATLKRNLSVASATGLEIVTVNL